MFCFSLGFFVLTKSFGLQTYELVIEGKVQVKMILLKMSQFHQMWTGSPKKNRSYTCVSCHFLNSCRILLLLFPTVSLKMKTWFPFNTVDYNRIVLKLHLPMITVDHKGSLIVMDFVFTHQLGCSLHLFFVSFSSLFCCFGSTVWTHSHHSHQPWFQTQLFSAHKKNLFKPNKCYMPCAKWHIKLAPNWWILLSIWQP